jgi:fumarate reductase subunit C
MTEVRTYIRSNAGWWMKNPTYKLYMAREVSSFFLFAYALVLLFGLQRFSEGPEAFNLWREAIASPISLLFHMAAFVFAVIHSVTWFMVMPKTMPKTQLSDRQIFVGGVGAVAAIALVFLVVVAGWGVAA